MATSSGRSERVYHQDYIARIRYSNALPPPPNPPKLLDIPNTGLSSGQYTAASFASRLAREQPLNIEADAELGMPIDLVGLPGVFDGDEKVIQPLRLPPPLHPDDKALLRPIGALGRPNARATQVSFLRRTEYITSGAGGGQRYESSTSTNSMRRHVKRRKPEGADDDPIHILRSIIKGFDLAYPQDAYKGQDSATNIRGGDITAREKEAWSRPQHPTNPGAKLLDSYPILPDLDAFPDAGSYVVAKYQTCPVPISDKYDERLDSALIRPIASEEEPVDPSQPPETKAYEVFLPSAGSTKAIKRKFSTLNPDNDDVNLYDSVSTQTGKNVFRYEHLRFYEPYSTTNTTSAYDDSVAITLHDPKSESDSSVRGQSHQKAAYYYPIAQKIFIRPKRAGNIKPGMMAASQLEEPEAIIDVIEAQVREPNDDEVEKRESFKSKYDITVEV